MGRSGRLRHNYGNVNATSTLDNTTIGWPLISASTSTTTEQRCLTGQREKDLKPVTRKK
ncbi:hypothetical protein QC762_200483 [Podospora pseudocomata]|uniref:Uncharacterized protein n=1 Tax=Podospora pseudocomata TaxID=2093779 RepID=A0ABR0GPN6_9PEZI|nr:hypothetical protein QC762_200483 [Podospora pseudocomata]